MGSSERPADRGRRRGRHLLRVALEEFRLARRSSSASQAAVAAALGKSDAWMSWTELGRNESLSVVDLAALLSTVGLELSLRAYPVGGGLRDEAQLALLRVLRELVAPVWNVATEVPVPIPGDLRAWDCALVRPACRIGIDAESRLGDFQAVDRRVMLKLRDSGFDRAIILVAATQRNRQALRALGDAAGANYPVPSRAALAALRAGTDPGGNAIVLLDSRPSRRTR